MERIEFVFALILICIGWSFLGSFRLETVFGSVFVAFGSYLIVDAFYFRRKR